MGKAKKRQEARKLRGERRLVSDVSIKQSGELMWMRLDGLICAENGEAPVLYPIKGEEAYYCKEVAQILLIAPCGMLYATLGRKESMEFMLRHTGGRHDQQIGYALGNEGIRTPASISVDLI
jgi:hypothetical protein